MSWVDLREPAADAAAKATEQLQSLRRKREGAEQRAADLVAEREAIGFAAHGAGDKAARKRLDEIHLEVAKHDSHRASIDAAIVEAERRLGAAGQEVELEAARQRAHQAREHIAEARKAGDRASAALDQFVAELLEFQENMGAIHSLGLGFRAEVISVNTKRAVQTALSRVSLGQYMPPTERAELGDLVDGWSRHVESTISATLGERAEAA